jgi:hypothetical protein
VAAGPTSPDDLIEAYRVRQATSWLASGHEQPRRRALAEERSLRQQALRDPQLAGLGDELAGLVRTLEGELEPAGVSRRARRG